MSGIDGLREASAIGCLFFRKARLIRSVSVYIWERQSPDWRRENCQSGDWRSRADLTASGSTLTIEIRLPSEELAAVDRRPAIVRVHSNIFVAGSKCSPHSSHGKGE